MAVPGAVLRTSKGLAAFLLAGALLAACGDDESSDVESADAEQEQADDVADGSDEADEPDEADQADEGAQDSEAAEDLGYGTVAVGGVDVAIDAVSCEDRGGFGTVTGSTHQVLAAGASGGDWRLIWDVGGEEVYTANFHAARYDVDDDTFGLEGSYRAYFADGDVDGELTITPGVGAQGEFVMRADDDTAEDENPDGIEVAVDVRC